MVARHVRKKLKFEKLAENLLLSWKYVPNIDSRKMLAISLLENDDKE